MCTLRRPTRKILSWKSFHVHGIKSHVRTASRPAVFITVNKSAQHVFRDWFVFGPTFRWYVYAVSNKKLIVYIRMYALDCAKSYVPPKILDKGRAMLASFTMHGLTLCVLLHRASVCAGQRSNKHHITKDIRR